MSELLKKTRLHVEYQLPYERPTLNESDLSSESLCEMDPFGFGESPLVGSCKYSNELVGSMKAETVANLEILLLHKIGD
jgi:hypothetical protein